MRWVESHLFDLGEIIDGVFVQGHFTDLAARELLLRPDMGQVEDVDALLLPHILGFFRRHGLDLDRPLGVLATLDGLVQILLRVVWRLVEGILLGDELGPLHGLQVDLAVDPFATLLDELQGMTGIPVHEAIAIRNTPVTHKNHDLVD